MPLTTYQEVRSWQTNFYSPNDDVIRISLSLSPTYTANTRNHDCCLFGQRESAEKASFRSLIKRQTPRDRFCGRFHCYKTSSSFSLLFLLSVVRSTSTTFPGDCLEISFFCPHTTSINRRQFLIISLVGWFVVRRTMNFFLFSLDCVYVCNGNCVHSLLPNRSTVCLIYNWLCLFICLAAKETFLLTSLLPLFT